MRAYLPSRIESLLVFPLVRRLPSLIMEFARCFFYYNLCYFLQSTNSLKPHVITYISLLSGFKSGVLLFELTDALEDLEVEQVIEHTVCATNVHVTVLKLGNVFICVFGRVHAHIVLFSEHGLKFLKLFNFPLLFQNVYLLLSRQNGQLVRHIEGMLLLFRARSCVCFTVTESDQEETAVTQVREVYVLLVAHAHQGCSTAHRIIDVLKRRFQNLHWV